MSNINTLKLLVTDDEPAMRLAVKRTIDGFKLHVAAVELDVSIAVEQASDGEEALASVAKSVPDVMLLDQKLPGLSGLEVLDRVSAAHPDLLVIMMTAYAGMDTAVAAIKRGAYDFLAKPFTPDELKNTVRKAGVRSVLAKQARVLTEERQRIRSDLAQSFVKDLSAPLNAIDEHLKALAAQSPASPIGACSAAISDCSNCMARMRQILTGLKDSSSG